LKNLRQNEDQKGIPVQMKALFSICIFGVACGAVYGLVPANDEPSFLVFKFYNYNLLKENVSGSRFGSRKSLSESLSRNSGSS
jgi:hypothetical protein